MSAVDEVSRHLRMKSVVIPPNNDWLASCVECFKEQGNHTLKQLSELVYQQWLLADLSDIGVQVLPDSCLSAEKVVLEGRYAVQFNFFVNIAVSFHKQLQKIRKPDSVKNLEVDCENTSTSKETVSNHRTLKIEITDGVLTIVGFEDHFIPQLHEPLVPGKKAILVGPLECRKGILFLRPANVQVLGGEVDALHISNANENILARALKLPENPDPYNLGTVEIQCVDSKVKSNDGFDDDVDALMMLAEVIENEVSTRANSEVKYSERPDFSVENVSSNVNLRQNFPSSVEDSLIADDFDDDMAELEQKINFKKNIESIEFDDDFELIEEKPAEAENTVANSKSNFTDNTSKSLPDCQIFNVEASKKQYEEITDLKNKLKESYGSNELCPSTSFNSPVSGRSCSDSLRKDKIIFDYLSEAESPLTKLTDEPECLDINSSKSSDIDFSDKNLLSSDAFPPKKRPALVKTPARVVKVLKKPKLKGDKWAVSAVVMAKGIELEVTFLSEVIDKIFTISAAEIVARRTELISDSSLKQKINETLKNSQMRFSTLSCVMVFSFHDFISKPVIVDVESH
ncbi:unnamed protein product [Nezara viridula]|uniref:RecQ-mediated genome instability protein 1 n=1 Tax=Nezara viridula TaxID=85310 RepID=A0A9P0E581_NEZVI|nr:unnamed protein product [Nezara viridula]